MELIQYLSGLLILRFREIRQIPDIPGVANIVKSSEDVGCRLQNTLFFP